MKPTALKLIARVLLALGAGVAAMPASAGVVVSPVVLEVASPRKPVTVTVTNDGDRAVTYQADALTWQQVNGVDRFEPTDELLVVPPIVEVPPKGRQVFRVMLRSGAPAPVERAYRLVFEDITEEASAKPGISFRLSHNLPVMVAPAGQVRHAIRWKPCAADTSARAATCVRLLNAGNRRVKLESVTVSGEGWQQVLSLKAGENVLAGAQRDWFVPLTSGQAGVVQSIQVKTARGETLQAESGGF